MKWGENITLEFVKIYGKHECLWNSAHPDYKIKEQRFKAYSDISAEFKQLFNKSMTIYEVRKKLKALRTTYMQQVDKIFEKSTPERIHSPSLIWFNEMDRLLKHVSILRHTTPHNNAQQSKEVDSSTQAWITPDIHNEATMDTHPDPLLANSDEYNETIKEEPVIALKKFVEHSSPMISKKKKFKFKKGTLKRKFFKLEDESNMEDSEIIEDEFDIYGKYIASQLRQMNLQKALRLQLTIQNLVSEARISELSN